MICYLKVFAFTVGRPDVNRQQWKPKWNPVIEKEEKTTGTYIHTLYSLCRA